MTEISELKSWIAYTENDYGAAKTLSSLKKPLLPSACFHAQQCAEKYLKALLILKDVELYKLSVHYSCIWKLNDRIPHSIFQTSRRRCHRHIYFARKTVLEQTLRRFKTFATL